MHIFTLVIRIIPKVYLFNGSFRSFGLVKGFFWALLVSSVLQNLAKWPTLWLLRHSLFLAGHLIILQMTSVVAPKTSSFLFILDSIQP